MPINFQLPDFINNIDWTEKRNKVASVLAGFLFFSGWWFALDASISHHADTRDVFHLCGVFSTISMFMVNAVSNSLLRGESFTEGCLGSVGARVWFFIGFMMGFVSFIGKIDLKIKKNINGENACIHSLYSFRKLLHSVWRICSPGQQRLHPKRYVSWSCILPPEPFHPCVQHYLQVWQNRGHVGIKTE